VKGRNKENQRYRQKKCRKEKLQRTRDRGKKTDRWEREKGGQADK